MFRGWFAVIRLSAPTERMERAGAMGTTPHDLVPSCVVSMKKEKEMAYT
jgi:hypothetical protein